MVSLDGREAEATVLEPMSLSIRHRGPDESSLMALGSVGFGFRRLSILDLSAKGHQPMASKDGQAVLVFNGEIYNFIEIRKELVSRGHEFQSSGDTEVLLHAYLEWGPECLKKLNGMWAFLLFDNRKKILFGARDRFGKKPFFRYRSGNRIFFASEIKAFQRSGFYRAAPNWKVVSRYFFEGDSLGSPQENQETFFVDIDEIPAGSAFEMDLSGRTREWRYWSLDDLPGNLVAESVQSFLEVFEDAVRVRLRSDVPVGVCLSGGLDSTSIICLMADELQRAGSSDGQLKAFSYIAPEFDESMFIEDTIRRTGAQLHKVKTDPRGLWDKMEEVVGYQDEPLHSMNVVIGYELYKLAAENGIKVILNGQGSDETLAGYHSYFTNYWYGLLKSGKLKETWKEIHAYSLGNGQNPKDLFLRASKHFYRSQLHRLRAYRKLANWRQQQRNRGDVWFHPDLARQAHRAEKPFEGQTLSQALKRSVTRFPLPLYLRVEDRNSMAHSVEVRLPFLDYRLVALEFQLPDHLKLLGPWNKFVLREAMLNRAPESVRGRIQKMGFPVPEEKWFANDLNKQLLDLLSSQQVRERGIYNLPAIRKDLELHSQGRINVSDRLFKIVQFEIWSKVTEERNLQLCPEHVNLVP